MLAFESLPLTAGSFAEELKCIRLLRAQFGPQMPLMITTFDPFQQLPFPEDDEHENVRPGRHERQFARDCGFDTIMSMRDAWRARARPNGKGGAERIDGLLVYLDGLQVRDDS